MTLRKKGAAISASTRPGPLHDFYGALVAKGMLDIPFYRTY
jgi:hypothetical protein